MPIKYEGTHLEILKFINRNRNNIKVISRHGITKTIMKSALDGGFGGYEEKEIHSVIYINI
jgi:hypothetical protein